MEDISSASSTAAVCSLCDRGAVYAFEGDVASLCGTHQPIDPVEALTQVVTGLPSRGCVNRVSHGREGEGVPTSCAAHVQSGMVQMRGVPCEVPRCRFAPVPALQGDGPGRRCKAHLATPFPGKADDDTAGRAGEKGQQNNSSSSGVVPETPGPADDKAAATTRKGRSSSKRLRGGASKAAALAAAAAQVERTDLQAAKGKAPVRGEGDSDGGSSSSSSSRQGATLSCESPLCNKNPSFGYRGQTRRRFCKRHAEPEMVNVYYRYCDADGDRCPERAFFEAEDKLRCLRHREPGMRPRNKICQVEGGGCTRQSSFGVEGGKPVLCTVHKQPGMVQVRTKTCRHQGCDKIPSYGYPCKSREFCKPHALEGMVYSAGSRCRFRGCELPGVFNYPWSTRGGSFCSIHKEDGMVDSTPKRCESNGCKYAANFGNAAQRTRRFCARHKLGGMLSYQELWPKPDENTTEAEAKPAPTNAETALAADLAAPVVVAAPSSILSSGQPQMTANSDAVGPAKRPCTQKTPSAGGQTATAPGPFALQSTESRGLAIEEQLNLVASASTAEIDGMPPPPPRLSASVGASAAPASSAMDLNFLADAAASAKPPSRTLGGHPAGGLHQSPATSDSDLHGSQAPAVSGGAITTATPAAGAPAAAAAASENNDTLLPSSENHLSIGGSSSGTTTTAATAGAAASGGASMPPVSTETSFASLDFDVDLSGGIGTEPLEGAAQPEEETFLANLVNSIDPSDPKTLRVRGAMMSRLKSVGRTTFAS